MVLMLVIALIGALLLLILGIVVLKEGGRMAKIGVIILAVVFLIGLGQVIVK